LLFTIIFHIFVLKIIINEKTLSMVEMLNKQSCYKLCPFALTNGKRGIPAMALEDERFSIFWKILRQCEVDNHAEVVTDENID